MPIYREYNLAYLKALGERPRPPAEPVPAAPWLHRWRTLSALLRSPEQAAIRMAKLLRKIKRTGGLRPHAMPIERSYRLPAEPALIAGILPDMVNDGLQAYWDTG